MVRIGEPIRLGARRRMIQAAPSVVKREPQTEQTGGARLVADCGTVTPRPDHAEHVDHRQTHQGDEQCFLGKSRALAGVVEPQRLKVIPLRNWVVSPKPVPLPALTSTTTALFSVGIIVASVSTPGLDLECLTVSLLGSGTIEPVLWGHFAGGSHHEGLALGAEHIILAIHHRLHVARQIRCARDDAGLWSRCEMSRVVGQRSFRSEPGPVPGRHRFVEFAVGDESIVVHADGLQNVLRDIGLVVLSADNFDQATEDLVVRVRVLHFSSGSYAGSTSASCSTRSASSSGPPVISVYDALPWNVEKPLVWLSSCRIVIAPAGWAENASR